jgi:hypothetical protein
LERHLPARRRVTDRPSPVAREVGKQSRQLLARSSQYIAWVHPSSVRQDQPYPVGTPKHGHGLRYGATARIAASQGASAKVCRTRSRVKSKWAPISQVSCRRRASASSRYCRSVAVLLGDRGFFALRYAAWRAQRAASIERRDAGGHKGGWRSVAAAEPDTRCVGLHEASRQQGSPPRPAPQPRQPHAGCERGPEDCSRAALATRASRSRWISTAT